MLRTVRESCNCSKAVLSRAIGVSHVYLKQVEDGWKPQGPVAPLTDERIRSAAAYLQIDPLPLIEAAAHERGQVSLITEGKSDNTKQLYILLAARPDSISDHVAQQLIDVLQAVA